MPFLFITQVKNKIMAISISFLLTEWMHQKGAVDSGECLSELHWMRNGKRFHIQIITHFKKHLYPCSYPSIVSCAHWLQKLALQRPPLWLHAWVCSPGKHPKLWPSIPAPNPQQWDLQASPGLACVDAKYYMLHISFLHSFWLKTQKLYFLSINTTIKEKTKVIIGFS